MGSLIGLLIGPITDILKRVIPDADARAAAQEEITKTIIDNEAAFMNAARDVIVAEAGGNWFVSAWRPTLMYLLMVLIVWLVVFCPMFGLTDATLKSVQGIPAQFWNLLIIGMGGYIAARSGEKIVSTIFKDK